MRPVAALLCALMAVTLFAAQKKKKEEVTQTLKLPEELPSAVTGETRKLAFHTTPLSAKGLLTPQVHEALKALQHEAGSETVLKIRVFVAGSGDLRHVRDLISEAFTARKQPLPTVALIKVGALPLEGAQVELEAIAEAKDKKDFNPSGLAFLSPTIATAEDPLGPVQPLVRKSLEGMRASLAAAKLMPADAVRVTCFVSSLAGVAETRSLVEAEYAHAALDFVQPSRSPGEALAACEAVARLHVTPADGVEFIGVGNGEAKAALVGASTVALTGSQYSFGYQESDARLAFERLAKSLEAVGANPANVAYAHYYPLSPSLEKEVRKVRSNFLKSPATTILLFEGLPSMDAGFGVDVVAVK
jgi:enamine deaminase RidA (YjgF/YER057c/UK114 family)